jgi:chaperonin cofactor prefoldin
MAKVGALRFASAEVGETPVWDRDAAKARMLSTFAAGAVEPGIERSEPAKSTLVQSIFARIDDFVRLRRAMPVLRFAAVLILAVLLAYETGLKKGVEREARISEPTQVAEATLRRQLADEQAGRATLNQKLAADAAVIDGLEKQANRAESELAQLQGLKSSVEAKMQAMTSQDTQRSTALAALSNERDTLQQQLRETDSALQAVRQDLTTSEEERQRVLLKSASLEAQLDQLSTRLREHEQSSERQQQYLASDRDIRELMGARQLYIADVFDVDPQGRTKKPFGRVFYTKGKSLIFYAFDLDQQPGYRDAKAFQAWGRQGSSQATPVSLGIFYMDSEANRRWVLKSEDPKMLEEINAVFVTLEPKGGSKKPTNKPFLLAYLHTAPPNHP